MSTRVGDSGREAPLQRTRSAEQLASAFHGLEEGASDEVTFKRAALDANQARHLELEVAAKNASSHNPRQAQEDASCALDQHGACCMLLVAPG